MWYPFCVVRRMVIAALALSLIGLGPVPLSTCALLSSKLAECSTPQTQSPCDKMNTEEGGTHFVALPDSSCCFARAPLPVSRYEASGLSLPLATPAAFSPIGDAPRRQNAHPALINQDLSPPALQSLLCTFLI